MLFGEKIKVFLGVYRQADLKGGAARFGGDVDGAAMFFDNDVVSDVEAEAGTAAGTFGGEEGVEYLGLDFGRDAGALVFDFNDNFVAFATGANSYLTFSIHGIDGVVEDVGPDLV